MIDKELVFVSEGNCSKFEVHSRENGITYWLASDLAEMLGYKDTKAVLKAIERASVVCMTAGIPYSENFQQISSGNDLFDIKMTRFACFLTVMQGDISNPRVAIAQAYFARLADDILPSSQIDRVYLRGEITDREKSLGKVAKDHGVENYPFFHNAGYRGLYNMNIAALKNKKGLSNKGDSLLDFMGSDELAANIFRITLTESKIKNQNIVGQKGLENAAEVVGRSVRNVMISNTGVAPEDLKLDESKVNAIKTDLKKTHKLLNKSKKPKK